MMKWLLWMMIVVDVVVVSARNLAMRGVRLDANTTRELDRFNELGLAVLALAGIFLLAMRVWGRKKMIRANRWPEEPPGM